MKRIHSEMSNIRGFRDFCYLFDTKPNMWEELEFPLNNAYFGILNIHTDQMEIKNTPQDLLFMIDTSGSMEENALKRHEYKPKIEFIKETMRNMINYFDNNMNVYITICTFNSVVNIVIERVNIMSENKKELLEKIDNISTGGLTNIGLALDLTNGLLHKWSEYNTKKTQIFMTDGIATMGEQSAERLMGYLIPSVKNIFIGLGNQHDADLLYLLNKHNTVMYYFIDEVEKSQVVYGEILYEIMYAILDNAKLIAENALFYDYKKNKWVSSMYIGDIVSDSNKYYHIISDNPEKCKFYLETSDSNTLFEVGKKMFDSKVDLQKYMYRQLILEILNKVNEHQFYIKPHEIEVRRDIYTKDYLKERITRTKEELTHYMKKEKKEEDTFYKNLCIDLMIASHTLEHRNARAYSNARLQSQGSERSSNVSYDGIEEPKTYGSQTKHKFIRDISNSNPSYKIDILDEIR